MDAVFFHVGDEKALSYNCCTPRAAPPLLTNSNCNPLPEVAFVASSFLARRGIAVSHFRNRSMPRG